MTYNSILSGNNYRHRNNINQEEEEQNRILYYSLISIDTLRKATKEQ